MQEYLTKTGQVIYNAILTHADEQNWSHEIDSYELSMLANSFDTYAICANSIKKNGLTQAAKNGFLTARPEVGIMQKEYAIILKHSDKFGLSPAARKKIFKLAERKRKPKKFLTSRTQEEEAYREWWESIYDTEPDMRHIDDYLKWIREKKEEPESVIDLI